MLRGYHCRPSLSHYHLKMPSNWSHDSRLLYLSFVSMASGNSLYPPPSLCFCRWIPMYAHHILILNLSKILKDISWLEILPFDNPKLLSPLFNPQKRIINLLSLSTNIFIFLEQKLHQKIALWYPIFWWFHQLHLRGC